MDFLFLINQVFTNNTEVQVLSDANYIMEKMRLLMNLQRRLVMMAVKVDDGKEGGESSSGASKPIIGISQQYVNAMIKKNVFQKHFHGWSELGEGLIQDTLNGCLAWEGTWDRWLVGWQDTTLLDGISLLSVLSPFLGVGSVTLL